ncbi:MAG: site-specific integrase [Candidatus Acidiferrales bacterium]
MRFYVQGEGHRKRVQKFLGTFEQLTKPQAKTKMAEALVELNNNPVLPIQSTQTFAAAAENWLAECETREDPVKPSAIVTWRGILTNHLNPQIGAMPLADVGNGTLKSVVKSLHHTHLDQKLKPATVHNIVTVAKLVVASAVDDDGDELFPRTWNSKFIGAPRVVTAKQNRPRFSATQVSQIANTATGQTQMLCVLLAASGLRIGEALGLECKHFDGACVHVVQTIWGNRGQVQTPKTQAADRYVDLHPDVSALLKQFIGTRTKGYIFQTSSGKPLSASIVLRRGLHPLLAELGIPRCGFHAFRRFRVTHLSKERCPYALLIFWVGHAKKKVTELYDQPEEDLVYRADVVRGVGTGFEVPKTLTPKQEKSSQPGVNARLDVQETPVNIG